MRKLKTTVLPALDGHACPCCERGTLVDSVCNRCGVGIARGTSYENPWTARRRGSNGAGNGEGTGNRRKQIFDYIRGKEDHQ